MTLTDSDLTDLLAALKAGEMTDTIRTSLEWVLQQLIEAELTAFIGAAPFERTESRTNLRNGRLSFPSAALPAGTRQPEVMLSTPYAADRVASTHRRVRAQRPDQGGCAFGHMGNVPVTFDDHRFRSHRRSQNAEGYGFSIASRRASASDTWLATDMFISAETSPALTMRSDRTIITEQNRIAPNTSQ